MKKCNKCKELKPIEEFGKNKNKKDGKMPSCKECSRKYAKAYWEKNSERLKPINREYKKNNKEKIKKKQKLYREKNAEVLREKRRIYNKQKYDSDPVFRNKAIIRARIIQALKGLMKPDKSEALLGCTWEEFNKYIESKFEEGMDWSNHGFGKGKWVIDHIKPIAAFDLSVPENFYECFHYTNQQPMWFEDNLKKGAVWNGKRWHKKS